MQQDGWVHFLNSCAYVCSLCLCVHAVPDGSRKSDTPLSNHDPRTAVQLRTALKRLKEIMEGKSQVSHLYNHFHASFEHLDMS